MGGHGIPAGNLPWTLGQKGYFRSSPRWPTSYNGLMGLQRFPTQEFHGLNTRDAPAELGPSESPDCLNVRPIDRESFVGLTQRGGSVKRSWTGAPAVAVDNAIWWWRMNMWVISLADGDIYSIPGGSGGVATLRYSGTTNDNKRFVVAPDSTGKETVWVTSYDANNFDPPQKWDGVAALFSAWANSPPNPGNHAVSGMVPSGHTYWRGRMIIWNANLQKNRVYFSDTGNPESPAAQYGNNFIDFLDDDTSSGITFCMPHQESLLVFREKGIWNVYDPNTFSNRRLLVGRGVWWPRHAVSHPNGRFYFYDLANDEVWSGNLRGDFIRESGKISPTLRTSFVTAQAISLAVTPDNTIFVTCNGVGDGAGGSPSRVLELFPLKPGQGRWFYHKLPQVMSQGASNLDGPGHTQGGAQDAEQRGLWFFIDSNNTLHFADPNATNDDGVAIDAYWSSAWQPFISEEPLERVRRVHPIYGGRADLDIYAEMVPQNLAACTPKATYSLSEVATSARAFPTLRPEARGRYHAFKIRNNVLNKTFELDKIERVFRGGKEHA